MISCTEFIPSYSELFSYLEDNYGRAEVDAFWKYLFVPDGKGIPLISFVEKEGIHYLGEKYGMDDVKAYLTRYTENVYKQTIADMEVRGLAALEAKIRDTYEKEKALDVLTTVLDSNALTVMVTECPAVKHLHETGREVSPWYRYTTEVVMSVLAKKGGFRFTMESYDEESGAAKYRFEK